MLRIINQLTASSNEQFGNLIIYSRNYPLMFFEIEFLIEPRFDTVTNFALWKAAVHHSCIANRQMIMTLWSFARYNEQKWNMLSGRYYIKLPSIRITTMNETAICIFWKYSITLINKRHTSLTELSQCPISAREILFEWKESFIKCQIHHSVD